MILLAATSLVGAVPPTPDHYLESFSTLARTDWPKNRTLTVVCHGHSVPAGYFRTPEVRALESYPHLLRVALARKYPHAVINVIVTAIGGEDAEKGALRFRRDVLALRPDVVTIDYALNDRRIGLEASRAAWGQMVQEAKAAGARVLLLTPTPDTKARWMEESDPLAQHAAMIRSLAASHEVGLVDSLSAFAKRVQSGAATDDFMSQFNHPNAEGHRLVAEAMDKWFP